MQSKEFFVIFENFNLITGVNTHCQCSMLIAVVVRILSRFLRPHGQQTERAHYLCSISHLWCGQSCITTMSLYVGST